MNLTIQQPAASTFCINLFFSTPRFEVSLYDSVKSKLPKNQELTNEKAISIFKQIKFKSDVMVFLTKPYVAVPIGIALFTLGLICATVDSVAIAILSLVLSAVGGGTIGFTIENSLNEFLPNLSKAYRQQSYEAKKAIENIKNNPDPKVKITLKEKTFAPLWHLRFIYV